MNPCRSNRKAIVLLAAGELDPEQAEQLRVHANSCPACARHLREMSAVSEALQTSAVEPGLEVSGALHSNVLRALRSPEPATPWSWFRQLTSTEKWGLAAVCLAVGLTVLSAMFVRISHVPPRYTVKNTAAGQTDLELAPTLSNYQIVASRSLEKFDELLTRQANRGLPSASLYTPASAPRGNGWD
jgi:anti-sigma factor RsiW